MKYNQSGQSNYEIIYLEKEYSSIRSVKLHEKKKEEEENTRRPPPEKMPTPRKIQWGTSYPY